MNLFILRFFVRRVVRLSRNYCNFEFKFLRDFREVFAIRIAIVPDYYPFCGRESKNIQGFSGTLFSKRGALGRLRSEKAMSLPAPGEDPLTKDRSSSLTEPTRDIFS
jgi:hypothetical protein